MNTQIRISTKNLNAHAMPNFPPAVSVKEIIMAKFKVGDRAKVLDRPGWPGGYKIANWEGRIVKVKGDLPCYVIMKADKTGNNMAFPENELEQLQPSIKAEQVSEHDGTLGFIDALQKKTSGKSVDARLD